jgi:hypothetical protein
MPNVLQAVENFLISQRSAHNGPDLIDRVLSGRMELQINVAAGSGEPVADARNTYSDGMNKWWNIRIPKNANSQPQWNDYPLTWPLDQHAEAIGSTGWDWEQRVSRWVGFDFDSITGHAVGVGVTPESLAEIRQRASALPWVEVRKSTGGSGLHLYVMLEVATANHTEHAALARHVLGLMATEAGFDFAANVDCCGGNMWIWHRKANPANEGFKLLKPATRQVSEAELAGWRDHVDVVTRKRAKVQVSGISDEQSFEALASSRKLCPLDPQHRAVMTALSENGFSTHWVADYHLLQTHTCALAAVLDRREELNLLGLFQTNSPGTNPGMPNCFAFPLENGAWKVYRFSPGIGEAETWEQDGKDWTWCYFNRAPGLSVACKAMGGNELENGKGFEFGTATAAIKAAAAIGQKIDLPDHFLLRPTVLKRNKDGRLVIEIRKADGDPNLPGWAGANKKFWARVFNQQTDPEDDSVDIDNLVRVLISPTGEHAGIVVRSRNGTWDFHPLSFAKMRVQAAGYEKAEAEMLIGQATDNRWERVSLPFQPEYPGDRRWNIDAAQLKVKPADRDAPHPHWDMILNHCGQSLTPALRELPWAREANIRTGADYLRANLAAIIRDPFEPTPYLFFYGPEGSGKSIYWEAFQELVTRGVVKADGVLSNQSDFNGQLVGAILCVVEEKDISKTPGALNRIKDYVTTRTLSIRRMRTDAYQIPNTTHWAQFSNDFAACPIFPGDTRITSIFVPPLEKRLPKEQLLDKIREEAPAFLRTLLDLNLPTRFDRLRIPIVETEDKHSLAEENAPLMGFIRECLKLDPNGRAAKQDVHQRYCEWNVDGETLNPIDFGRQLRRLLPGVTTCKMDQAGRRVNGYAGIVLDVLDVL